MQNASLICRQRQGGPSAWEFRWREPGSDGKRRHRRFVLGSTLEFVDECAARQAIVALQLEIIGNDVRTLGTTITLAAAYSHFRQQELRTESARSTFSTRNGYEESQKVGNPPVGHTDVAEHLEKFNCGCDRCHWHVQLAPRSETS